MPRGTGKSKAKNVNANVKSCNVSKKSATATIKNDKIAKCIKEELVTRENVAEEVFHRKSERRRVARDIFLVFEEQSNSRRRTRGSTRKKQIKPKFGHLQVEEVIKPKGLLRDIKNEPQCYLSDSNFNVNSAIVPPALSVNSKKISVQSVGKEEKKVKAKRNKKTTVSKTVNSSYPNNDKLINTPAPPVESTCALDIEHRLVPRVNPIFLWVKQDDTRIVEVRCEDYDKRNRIRITKTSNGWCAIPRSDPTSSRVLKFYPTHLMKVKKENNVHERSNGINTLSENKETIMLNDFGTQNILLEKTKNSVTTNLKGVDTVCNPLAIKNARSKTKKAKKLKKKTRSGKYQKKAKTNEAAIQDQTLRFESLAKPENVPLNLNSCENEGLVYSNVRYESETNVGKSEKSLSPTNLFKNIHVETTENKPSGRSSIMLDVPAGTESTYQNKSESELSFHLCARTGLFLPSNQLSNPEYEEGSFDIETDVQNRPNIPKSLFLNPGKEEFLAVNFDKIDSESKMQMAEDNPESLEAKTKNLKDLLDNADLLQHCDDNANSDAELIDSLVKTSCENNLIQSNEVITKSTMDQLQQKTISLDDGTNEMVAQLLTDVSNPPKCLSFNEAGEIEGVNGELFQPNSYIENFDKQSASLLVPEAQITLHSTTSVVESSPSQNLSTCENVEHSSAIIDANSSKASCVSLIEDSPKDLSYRKREEVCPPSESRSQCAVTSSSDVIKSPQREDTSLASSSETLKNLILEQFMKLNSFSNQQQRDVKVLGGQSKLGQSSDFIETVVIEDDDDIGEHEEEPLKKRSRLNKNNVVTQNLSNIAMIDKDPDPLTQLRLLIKNTQWKVPDPILVPKDRLSAVLASPAREIPLLITTRPELRLPEAFAYPEIIQNPNILVISMAQLEAILKNKHEAQDTSSKAVLKPNVVRELCEEQLDIQFTNNNINEIQAQSHKQHIQHSLKMQPTHVLSSASNSQVPNQITESSSSISSRPLSETRKENAKCSQTDSCLSTELNSATMAVLNQMFWLPYFGQISQDIVKSLKNPVVLQEKISNFVPFFNSNLNSLTNLEDTYKSDTNKTSTKSNSNNGFQQTQQQQQHQIETNDELSLFQKIVQHQMQSVLKLNQFKQNPSPLTIPLISSTDKTNLTNIIPTPPANYVEQSKPKMVLQNKQASALPVHNKDTSVSERSYNLRSSVAARQPTAESKQYPNNNQRQNTDNKPRLTCKSLSNLLEPEHNMVPLSSSSSIHNVHNLSSDFLKGSNDIKECNSNDRNTERKAAVFNVSSNLPTSARHFDIADASIESRNIPEISKQRSKTFDDSLAPENNNAGSDASGLSGENVPLWHPLFGSNTKSAYSSPWQWTTVTATGE